MDGHEQLELRYVPLSTVALWESNPKLHDSSGICDSIGRYGFGDPPKFDATLNALVYGNGRIEALSDLRSAGKEPPRGVLPGEGEHADDWLVPVVFGVDQASVEMAERFALDHNSLTLGPRFDAAEAAKMWRPDTVKKVARTWTEAARTLIVPLPAAQKAKTRRASPTKGRSKGRNEDALQRAMELQERWKVKVGDRFRVGPFVVACADSQDGDLVQALFKAVEFKPKTTVTLTNPPALQEAGKRDDMWGEIASDGLSTAGYTALLKNALAAARTSNTYVFVEWSMWNVLCGIAEEAGLTASGMLVWDKMKPALGGLWRPQHELILWATKGRAGKRQQGHATIGNVLPCERPGNRHHYDERPVDLLADVLRNDEAAGRRKAPVFDPFMGSASTLLAAARSGRLGLGIDVEPMCVAVALERLKEELGEEPEAMS